MSVHTLACFLSVALASALVSTAGAKPAANHWSRVGGPTLEPAQVVGGVAHGCLAGGVALPADGPGYQVIRLSRKRYFGHPDTIAFIERLGQAAEAAKLAAFYVGDMAQPRGGPLPYGHASHQTGLDVDIWFNLDPKPSLPALSREDVDLPSMLPDGRHIDLDRFGASQVSLLRLAASDPHVDRIFVNPVIKDALCRGVGGAGRGDRTWLHRVRPWYGHDEHFHVRLSCPADSPECEAQAPVPPGDGCDATLAAWFGKTLPSSGPIEPKPPKPKLPTACHAILVAP